MRLYQSQRPTKFAYPLAIVAAMASSVFAQSGSRTGAGSPPAVGGSASNISPAGSANRGIESPVGLQGYCPVCLAQMRQWIKGDARLSSEFDGKRYYFPGAEQAEMFEQDPLKYVPVLGGDDVVHLARTGKRVGGKLNYGMIHQGRTYFFASGENKQLFQASPESYESADLALDGECIVCRVDMKERVPGKPEFTALYNGLRYQFPGEEQQTAFSKSPARYIEALSPSPGRTPAGSGTRQPSAPQPSAGGSGTR
jgi:YHS domain-containing protein